MGFKARIQWGRVESHSQENILIQHTTRDWIIYDQLTSKGQIMQAGGVGKEQVLFFFLPFLSGICIGVYN